MLGLFPGSAYHRSGDHIGFVKTQLEIQNLEIEHCALFDVRKLLGYAIVHTPAETQILLAHLLFDTHDSNRRNILAFDIDLKLDKGLAKYLTDSVLQRLMGSLKASDLELAAYLARYLFAQSSDPVGFVAGLSDILEANIGIAQSVNLAKSSQSAPLNGVLAAISLCLQAVDWKWCRTNSTLVARIISLAHLACQVVLEVCVE